jgi:hypothetical protein
LETPRAALHKPTLLQQYIYLTSRLSQPSQHGSRTPKEEEQVVNTEEAPEWTLEEEDSAKPNYREALVCTFLPFSELLLTAVLQEPT